MSVAEKLPYSSAAPPEAFGQTGVLQYAGRLIAWAMMTVGLSAAAMSFRSTNFSDGLEWKNRGQVLQVISGSGQLAIIGVNSATRIAPESGWSYRGAYGSRWANRGPWQSVTGEAIGIEGALHSPSTEYDSGFWLRVKWPTVAVLFMIQPVLYVLRRVAAWARARANAPAA